MAHSTPVRLPFHYGWLIVGTGTLCILACLGFGRFALGMLLPSMAKGLALTYSQMGIISTGNFVGYLLSVLVSGFLTRRLGPRRLIFAALLLVGISMILLSRASRFPFLVFLYLLTGIGSGASNVPMMGLVSRWFDRSKRGKASGLIAIGSGFAIVLSGKLIPFINSTKGIEGWRTSWLLLGTTVLAIAFICYLLLRDRPEAVGLKPVGKEGTYHPNPSHHHAAVTGRPIYRQGTILHLGALYFLFGCTYVIYVTFIVTTLVKEMGFTELQAGEMWAWVGLLSLFSGPLFGTLSDTLGRKAGFTMVFLLQMSSYFLVASGLAGGYLYLSIVLFGITAWSIPAIMAASVGDYAGAERAAEAFGFITFIFGLGQIAGPLLAGFLAEDSGSFSLSFTMAGALAAVAAALSTLLKGRKRQR